jgi:hypothetical protein
LGFSSLGAVQLVLSYPKASLCSLTQALLQEAAVPRLSGDSDFPGYALPKSMLQRVIAELQEKQ